MYPSIVNKTKIHKLNIAIPKIRCLVVGLTITVAAWTAIGMLDSHSASAVTIIVPGHHRR